MTRFTKRILIVDDDAGLRAQMKWAFEDLEVFEAQDRKEAIALVRRVEPDVVLLDLGLPPSPHDTREGFATLQDVRIERPAAKIIVITGQDDRAIARQAVAHGAYDFFAKPPDLDEVRLIVTRALALIELEGENDKLAAQKSENPVPGFITQNPAMVALCRTVQRVAATNSSVMFTGETGTGKSMLAKAIHDLSPRRDGPFINVDCRLIPADSLAGELFGYEKTGSKGVPRPIAGKIEQANRGTLFLDAIDEAAPPIQARLLRALQERCLEREGGSKLIVVDDVRIVSATTKDLGDARPAGTGTLRDDLSFRLGEIGLAIPPLRDREEDAALLARHFLRIEARNLNIPPKKIGVRAIGAISRHAWPGNVRELQARVKRALVLCDRDMLEPSDFELLDDAGSDLPTLREERQRSERKLVQRALTTANGNMSEAARLLGVSRPTLYELLRNLEISPPST